MTWCRVYVGLVGEVILLELSQSFIGCFVSYCHGQQVTLAAYTQQMHLTRAYLFGNVKAVQFMERGLSCRP